MKWWRQRSSRQKQVLMVASASLSAVVLFLLLEPLVEERRRLSAELPRLREDLAWMEAHVDKAKKLSVPAATEGQQVSPAQVESLLQQTGIRQQVAGMQPLAGQGMQLSFNNVNFPDLLVFISRLQDEGYARIGSTEVNGTGAYDGQVTAELKLLPR